MNDEPVKEQRLTLTFRKKIYLPLIVMYRTFPSSYSKKSYSVCYNSQKEDCKKTKSDTPYLEKECKETTVIKWKEIRKNNWKKTMPEKQMKPPGNNCR